MEAKISPKIQEKNGAVAEKPRQPVVVVMGHVDHGKTTLLDYIRKANVAAREAGGITQAVGSYEIEHVPGSGAGYSDGSGDSGDTSDSSGAGSNAAARASATRKITFIDTPGHEAFTTMRSRGAAIADLAILVVAADEGVKPQTKEAIQILNDTKTPFIVAMNKIDKLPDRGAGTGLEKAKSDLAAAGVLVEGYGGQVSWHGISAKTGEGVGELLDLILLLADLEHLSYDPHAAGSGFVLEARRDPRRGIEAMVIVKNGIMRRGEPIKSYGADGKVMEGKVKILENFLGRPVTELPAGSPATVIGLEDLPRAGEAFATGADAESLLKESEKKIFAAAGADGARNARVVAQGVRAAIAGKIQHLNLILSASDSGSLEALMRVIKGITPPEGKDIRIVESSVGDVTDGDVKHAVATGAAIIGFKNRVEKGAEVLADAQSISIITSKIVYDLEKAVEEFLAGSAGPAVLGKLEVLAIFNQEKLDKQLVGGRVVSGVFREKMGCSILRSAAGSDAQAAGAVLAAGAAAPAALSYETAGSGRVINLREKKSEITQAEEGKEIGMLISSQVEIKVGDVLVINK